MTRCWVCNEEFGVDGVHICANTPFKIKPTMTKVTIDRALIESELKALAAKGCGKCFAQDCDWPECHPRAKELRAALAEPAVEPVKGLFVDLIAQHPGLAEELAAITIDAPPAEPAVEPVAVHQVKLDARRWRDIAKDEMQNYIAKGFWETRTLYTSPPPPAESVKPPGMAVQALAGEIVAALLADEKDGGYDLTAGMFGPAFSVLVRRWAAAEWNSPPAEPVVDDLSAIEKEIAETCMETPLGWRCTRKAGHDGPCAAVPAPEDIEFVRKGMARLKESESPTKPQVEPAPEPVAFALVFYGDKRICLSTVFDTQLEAQEYADRCQTPVKIVSLYAAPVREPAPVPLLSDDEVAQCIKDASKGSAINRDGSTSQRIVRSAEQLVRRKARL